MCHDFRNSRKMRSLKIRIYYQNFIKKITEELFKKINIKDNQQRLTTLRALDKIDRLGWSGVKELLGEGRKDNSGDFTKGANLNPNDVKKQ